MFKEICKTQTYYVATEMKEIRESLGLSLRQVAEQVGLSHQMILLIENGRPIKEERAQQIYDLFREVKLRNPPQE